MMIKEEKSIMQEFKIFGGGVKYLILKYCITKERSSAYIYSGQVVIEYEISKTTKEYVLEKKGCVL